jgi:hypothetical protein
VICPEFQFSGSDFLARLNMRHKMPLMEKRKPGTRKKNGMAK